jgi:hypothetical protein
MRALSLVALAAVGVAFLSACDGGPPLYQDGDIYPQPAPQPPQDDTPKFLAAVAGPQWISSNRMVQFSPNGTFEARVTGLTNHQKITTTTSTFVQAQCDIRFSGTTTFSNSGLGAYETLTLTATSSQVISAQDGPEPSSDDPAPQICQGYANWIMANPTLFSVAAYASDHIEGNEILYGSPDSDGNLYSFEFFHSLLSMNGSPEFFTRQGIPLDVSDRVFQEVLGKFTSIVDPQATVTINPGSHILRAISSDCGVTYTVQMAGIVIQDGRISVQGTLASRETLPAAKGSSAKCPSFAAMFENVAKTGIEFGYLDVTFSGTSCSQGSTLVSLKGPDDYVFEFQRPKCQ